MAKRFVVEGAWLEGNEGSPVTRDFVIAADADAAIALVERTRERLEPWQSDIAVPFEEFIERESAILREMAAMSIEAVEKSWAETKASLGDDEDEEIDEEIDDDCGVAGADCREGL
jgi:hypothetical protein